MLHGFAPVFIALYERFYIGEFTLLRLRSNPLLMRNYGMSIKASYARDPYPLLQSALGLFVI